MPFPTITEYYEEHNFKKVSTVVSVAGNLLTPNARSLDYDFGMGVVPTCSFTIDAPAPEYVQKDASVQVFVGFYLSTTLVFNGTIESVSPSESGLTIQCSGQSKKLDAPYKAEVTATDGVSDVSDLIAGIFEGANVFSYTIDLPPWVPGTVSPQPLNFSSWGEGVNKLAEPFGSPYYEMPSGYIRVDTRDPIPGPTAFRTYFSGILTDGVYAQPAAVAAVNVNAQPRLKAASSEMLSRDVRNKIIARGAEIHSTGGDGEAISTLLETTAFGPSPWIPQVNGVDQYVELIFQNEFIDTLVDLAAVATRLFNVWNRLYEKVSITVDGDPEIFLGATVNVIDLGYSRINGKYVVMGYSTSLSSGGFTTTLELQGGRASGVLPALAPWAFFTWLNANVPIPPRININKNNPNNKSPLAAKVRQFIPNKDPDMPPDPEDPGQDPTDPGDPGQRVIVLFDGGASVDPDGSIVSYVWLDNLGNTGTGRRVTMLFNPGDVDTIDMTLTVTDNSGLTDSVTQTVNVNTFGPTDPSTPPDDPTTEDESAGGGEVAIPVIFVSLGSEGVAATEPGDGGSSFFVYPGFDYNPRGVVSASYKETNDLIAIFGGSAAYISTAYLEVPPTIVDYGGNYGFVNDIAGDGGNFSAVSSDGTSSWVLRSADWGQTWTVQATLAQDVLLRISGNYCLGKKGVWILQDDGTFLPLDPDQDTAHIDEPAYILVNDDSLLFNNRYIANVNAITFDGSGLTQGAGILSTPDFSKVIIGSDSYIAMNVTGHLFEGNGTLWTEISEGTNGLTNAYDFVAEGGQDGVYLAANSQGVSKTVDKGVTWRKLALRASGILTIGDAMTDPIVAGDTMTIGAKTYTFVADADPMALPTPLPGPVADGEIGVTGSIIDAINGADMINTPHPLVTAESTDGITIRAIVPGVAGDSIVTTETFTSAANHFDADTLGARVARIALKLPDQVTVGDTMTIEAKTFSFVGAAAMNGEITVGASTADTQVNIVAAINGTDMINAPHAVVKSQDFVANTAVIETIAVQPPGYSMLRSETFTSANNVFVAGSTLASELPQAYRLQAVNVPQTAPTADLYSVTETAPGDEEGL